MVRFLRAHLLMVFAAVTLLPTSARAGGVVSTGKSALGVILSTEDVGLCVDESISLHGTGEKRTCELECTSSIREFTDPDGRRVRPPPMPRAPPRGAIARGEEIPDGPFVSPRVAPLDGPGSRQGAYPLIGPDSNKKTAPSGEFDPASLPQTPAGLVGLNKKDEQSNYIYRALNEADEAAIAAGQPLAPQGTGGSIVEHIQGGRATKYMSASETREGAEKYRGQYGVVRIDVDKARAGGSRIIPHDQVMQALQQGSGATPTDRQNAAEAREVLIRVGVPLSAIERVP